MKYDLALKVIKSESYEQTAERIVELYEKIQNFWDYSTGKKNDYSQCHYGLAYCINRKKINCDGCQPDNYEINS